LDCLRKFERSLRALRDDVVELDRLIAAGGALVESKVRASREPSTPISLGIEALRAEIDFTLQFWAECLGMESLVGVRLSVRIERSVEYLERRMPQLLDLGPQMQAVWRNGEPARNKDGSRRMTKVDGLHGALHFTALHRRVRVVAGRTKLVIKLAPACAHCGHHSLVRHDGDELVRCENCGDSYDMKHHDWFVRVTLAAAQEVA
jgi:hypothetical protein